MQRTERYVSKVERDYRKSLGKQIVRIFNVNSKEIKYLSNSFDYPDTVTISADTLASGNIFAIIRKDENNKIDSSYVLTNSELVAVMHKCQEETKKLASIHYADVDKSGVLAKIPYSYMWLYKFTFNN